MYIRILFAFWLLTISVGAVSAQAYDFLAGRNLAQIEALAQDFGLPSALYDPITGVDAYRVSYEMPFLGETISVSGALFEPVDLDPACSHPVHIYMHGTIFARTDAPSFLSYEGQLGYLMAGLGFTVLMPDYVGLGTDDQHLHPYVHAQSEALAGAHLIQAVHETPNPTGNSHDLEQLFISGYSQGGHAAMALHRELQANWPQYPVTASAPGSGPYSITGVQFPETFSSDTYSNPSYLAYTALAWESLYGNLYEDPSEYFQEPYASQLEGLFNGVTTGPQINAALPYLTADFVQMGILDSLLTEGHPFLVAATDNDVYDWVPDVPLRIYYCTEDEQVFYQNALFAEEHMNGLGASEVEAINLGAYDHNGCAGQAIFGATLWFQAQAEVCGTNTSVSGTHQRPTDTAAFPNPTHGAKCVQWPGPAGSWELLTIDGRRVESGFGTQGCFEGLAPGTYVLSTHDGLSVQRIIVTNE
jgi:acetyl esterase/lipase